MKKEEKGKKPGIRGRLRQLLQSYNRSMRKVYSPRTAAVTGTVLVLVMILFTLFIPPYLGVADDGSLTGVMRNTGLGYREQDLEWPTGAYHTRLLLHSTRLPEGVSTHTLLIRLAMWADDQFTGDNFFDLRFLAALYTLLYLPAVYLVLLGMTARVRAASEATFLVILGAVVLGDAGITAYFCSLYPEALWQVCMMYCLGFAMLLCRERLWMTQVGIGGFLAAGSVLVLSESHLAAAGLVFTVFLVRMIFMENRTAQTSIAAAVCAAVMAAMSLAGAMAGSDRFSEASKVHAMTNGVLLRSENPAETLSEFGIEPRFEVLTDQSTYDAYPPVLSGNPDLKRGFLSRYNTGTILLHYVRHPLNYAGLLELAVRAAFHPVRSYVGNFEASSGRPERSLNGTLTFYTNLKANSLPQTLGFLAILGGVYWALFRKRRGMRHHQTKFSLRERQVMLDTFLMLILTGIAHLTAILMLSGTAELERYQMLCGVCIDGMLLLFIAEILHRLNILSAEE